MLLSIVMAAAASASAGATDAAGSPLFSLLRKNYSPDVPLSTKFTLTIYWSVREKAEKKKGRIWLAPGDRFRVTFDRETLASDGETFRQYSAGTNQFVVRRLADVDRDALPSQLFARYLAAYPFRETGRENGIVTFSWNSDSAEAQYREIRMTVHEKSRRITGCVMTDRNGNTFTYTFSATVFGEKSPKGRFTLDVPKNARVVDMRQ